MQFGIWLAGVARGDFGVSISLRRDVLELLMERLPATLELAGLACTVAVAIGVTVSVIGVLMCRYKVEAVLDGVNGLLLAVPDFVWALAFVPC